MTIRRAASPGAAYGNEKFPSRRQCRVSAGSYAIALEDVGIGCTMLHRHLTEIDLDEKNSLKVPLGCASACGKEFAEIVSLLVFQSFSV